MFANSHGEPLAPRCSLGQKQFKPLIGRAKLPEKFSLYPRRRTFAALATATEASLRGGSVETGHADPGFTDEVYMTNLPMQKSVSDVLENRKSAVSRIAPTFRTQIALTD